MAKIIIYSQDSGEKGGRKAKAEGVDFTLAKEWDDLSNSLKSREDIDLVIVDASSSASQPDITRRIKKIKDIPVLYFEETKPGDCPAGVETSRQMPASAEQSEWDEESMDDPLERARRFLDDNFKKQLTLAEIAEVADISPSYFCRKFKSRFDMSPISYLRNLRIDRACHLLERTNLPLSEITSQSGFFSIPYFCREFRKVKGISPIQYRRTRAKEVKAD